MMISCLILQAVVALPTCSVNRLSIVLVHSPAGRGAGSDVTVAIIEILPQYILPRVFFTIGSDSVAPVK
jgi:hypothetical protein